MHMQQQDPQRNPEPYLLNYDCINNSIPTALPAAPTGK